MESSGIEIRRAGAADAPALAQLLAAAFAEYEAAYTPAAFAATTPGADQIRARLPEGPVWIALQQACPVGTVSAVRRGETVYLRSMAVLPAARGLGAGARLLHEVEAFARHAGATALLLSTTPFLTRALRLYEHYGFQPSPAGPHDLHGTPLLTLVKSLAP